MLKTEKPEHSLSLQHSSILIGKPSTFLVSGTQVDNFDILPASEVQVVCSLLEKFENGWV